MIQQHLSAQARPKQALHDTSIKIIVVRLCICLSITGGQRKQFDPEKQEAVSLAIEARTGQSL